MYQCILVPGFEGTGLQCPSSNDQTWPPYLYEILLDSYDRLNDLENSSDIVTDIITNIECYPVYQPLIDRLTAIAQAHGGVLTIFPYDWRIEIGTSAKALATLIAASASDHIVLVAHSGGELVVRRLLEDKKKQHKPWFAKIKTFLSIATPHLGSPDLLFKCLGIEGSLGISPQDAKLLTADPTYPGPESALPRPGQQVLWDISSGTPVAKSLYDPAVIAELHLPVMNIGKAKKSWAKLGAQPTGVNYVMIAGIDQTTDEGVQYDEGGFHPIQDYAGDSVVPAWSAAPPGSYAFTLPGDHVGMLNQYNFKVILQQILGGPAPMLLIKNGVDISLNRRVYAPGEVATILLIPNQATTGLDGVLLLQRVTRVGDRTFAPLEVKYPISYHGPEIEFLRLHVKVPEESGAYRFALLGSHRTDESAGYFGVNPIAKLQLSRKAAEKR